MYQIIGVEDRTYTFDEGKTVVSGKNIYMTTQRDKVTGYACERVFVSSNKLGDYVPRPGDYIDVLYNRFGKVQEIRCTASGK